MMETPSDYSSESDEDQYYDATEEVHLEKMEEVHQNIEAVQRLRLDDMFGSGEPTQKIIAEKESDGKKKGEDIVTGEMDSKTQTIKPACADNVKDQASSTGSEIDNNIATDPDNSEYNLPPEINLEKCDKSTLEPNKTHSDEDINEQSDTSENSDVNKEEMPVKDEMAARIEMEERLSEEEKLERKEKAQQNKLQGNAFFKSEEYLEACDAYTTALEVCPLTFKKERSIMYSNRAACRLRLEQLEEAVSDCTEAITLNPLYMKALLRRAKTYELLEKLDESLADYQKALEMDAGCHEARSACMRLPDLIKERNEKLKEEMMGKLKDLGNMVLHPFGLSTNNFQFQQDPNTGSYSMNFVQTPRGGNGK